MASLKEIANKYTPPIEYNKIEYFAKYIDIFIKTSPLYGKFKTFENLKLNLNTSDELRIFTYIKDDLYLHLIDNEIIKSHNKTESSLTEKGRKIKNGELEYESRLKLENLELQNESLKYKEKIRHQEQRIRDLDEALKTYDFIKKYWFVFIIVGLLILKYLEIIVVYIYNKLL